MFGWAILFLIVAIVAGLLGFGVIATATFAIAKIVFWIAVVLLVIALIAGLMGRASRPPA